MAALRTLRPHALVPVARLARGHAVAVEPRTAAPVDGAVRNDWSRAEVQRIFDGPLMETIFRAASVHRMHHDPSRIQLCTLMNIKSESASRVPVAGVRRGLVPAPVLRRSAAPIWRPISP